jgi:hypothetical protein
MKMSYAQAANESPYNAICERYGAQAISVYVTSRSSLEQIFPTSGVTFIGNKATREYKYQTFA